MSHSAKVLAPADVRRVLAHVRQGRCASRNSVIILLSFRAGLRACEIAGLDWSMVLATNGRIAAALEIPGSIAKNGRGRRIPMHVELKSALGQHHRFCDRVSTGAVVRSMRGSHMTPRSIVNWFAAVFAELDLQGCSSHSGRRTFITELARLVARTGGSLRDVQELAGHRALSTTERYIEGNRDAQRKLVRLL